MINRQIALEAWNLQFDEWAAIENELREKFPYGETTECTEGLRRWWQVTSDLLLAAVHLEVHFGLRPDPPIHELLAKLSVTAADLANGNVPVLVSGVVTEGRPKTWDAERRDIGRAVRYVEAVRAGRINDPRPNATVKGAFGVSAPTVRQWCQRGTYYLYRLPALANEPDRAAREMFEAGSRYRVYGRGALAILKRDAKR